MPALMVLVVIWSGDDLQWFGCPYFVVPRVDGDVVRGDWVLALTAGQHRDMAKQAMTALAGIHRVDWQAKCGYLGEFWGFEFDVTRWDRFYERAAEPERLALQPRVKELLLRRLPQETRIGLYHGDLRANLMSARWQVAAVIDGALRYRRL
jgi:aminoglycoside phosphotransferase (APT) family kinase protein